MIRHSLGGECKNRLGMNFLLEVGGNYRLGTNRLTDRCFRNQKEVGGNCHLGMIHLLEAAAVGTAPDIADRTAAGTALGTVSDTLVDTDLHTALGILGGSLLDRILLEEGTRLQTEEVCLRAIHQRMAADSFLPRRHALPRAVNLAGEILGYPEARPSVRRQKIPYTRPDFQGFHSRSYSQIQRIRRGRWYS